MSEMIALQQSPDDQLHDILRKIITRGDISGLTSEQQIHYYIDLCHKLELNPFTKPFDFIEIENKKTGQKKVSLYANKECAAQLKRNHKVSIWKVETRIEDGCCIATAYARTPDGREDIDEGVTWVKGLASENLSNLRMVAVTKAKRRVTLSICGLGFLDESEIDSIPNVQRLPDPEQDAVMTDHERWQLTIAHKASGLDQWKCGRATAMSLIHICKALEAVGASEDIWRGWLPEGIQSRKELIEERAREVFDNFTFRLRLIQVCMKLGAKGVDKELMRERLPDGAKSVFALTDAQTIEALKAFTHWLKSYEEAVNNAIS